MNRKLLRKLVFPVLTASMIFSTCVNVNALEEPVIMYSSALEQSNVFAPGYKDKNYTLDQYKELLSQAITEFEDLWNINGGYEYYKSNASICGFVENIVPKAKMYLEEGLSTEKTYSWRLKEVLSAVDALKDEDNILSELVRNVYTLYNTMKNTDSSEYTATSWKTYETKVLEAIALANSDAYNEDALAVLYQEALTLQDNLEKVNLDLLALNELVSENEAFIVSMQDDSTIMYTRESWLIYTNAFNAANQAIWNGEDADYKVLYDALVSAKASLVTSTIGPNKEVGIYKEWKQANLSSNLKVRGGQLYVSKEESLENKSVLSIVWINDGTSPLTGGAFVNTGEAAYRFGQRGLRYVSENDLQEQVILQALDTNGNVVNQIFLNKEQVLNGTTCMLEVPRGSQVALKLLNSSFETYSLGIYGTTPKTVVEPVQNDTIQQNNVKKQKEMVKTLYNSSYITYILLAGISFLGMLFTRKRIR